MVDELLYSDKIIWKGIKYLLIILLSPAKTMNFQDSLPNDTDKTEPYFLARAKYLNNILRSYDTVQLRNIMKISNKLVPRVTNMISGFSGDGGKGRQAIYAYRGAVFQALDSLTLNKDQLYFAQDHIRILSGLYGVLKAFDSIEEYRLDMKTVLKTDRSDNLYKYWNNSLTNYFCSTYKNETIINLASSEYSKVIKFSKFSANIIDISFAELSDNQLKSPPMYSKIARGRLAGYILRNLITDTEKIKKFNLDNYSFNKKYSNDKQFIFTR
jgi:uncharacterized protein